MLLLRPFASILLILACCCWTTTSLQAQVKPTYVSKADKLKEQKLSPRLQQKLAAYRVRGLREGWTFGVSTTPVFNYRLDLITGAVPPGIGVQPKLNKNGSAPGSANQFSMSFGSNGSRLDLREYGLVSPVKNQRACGSCWAFAAASCIETAWLARNSRTSSTIPDLSEQYMLSCSGGGNCAQGGQPDRVFEHFRRNGKGCPVENQQPYGANDASCPARPRFSEFKVERWNRISSRRVASTLALKDAIARYGGVQTYIRVTNSFTVYRSGVFNDRNTASGAWHIVHLIGWDDAKQAFLIKNSWDTGWGSNGYGWVKYGIAEIGSFASYVVAKKKTPPVPIHNISGNWVNEDTNTRSVTRLSINTAKTIIHPYGACTPRECDWGDISMRASSSTRNLYNATHDPGFGVKKIRVTALSSNRIKVQIKATYRDGRAARSTVEYFKRAPLNIRPILPERPRVIPAQVGTTTWFNEKKDGGIPKIIIRNDFTHIHVFGKCSPNDCDWGTVKLKRKNAMSHRYFARYEQGFAVKDITVDRLTQDRIRVVIRADYTNPSRTDRTDTYYLTTRRNR